MRKPLLLLPGPMQLPESVAVAGTAPLFNHRSSRMDKLLERLEALSQPVFGTAHEILFFAASGTGVMESAVANLASPGEAVVVFTGGTFAERWVEIGRAYGLDVRPCAVDWPTGPTLDDARRAVSENSDAEVFFLTWSESSTGVLTELSGICGYLRSQGKIVAVDAVSGLGVSPLEMDACAVDAVIAGSQKGLMLPAGLGVAAVGPRAWDKAAGARSPRYYWDWSKYRHAVPFTPPLSIMFQLEASLGLMHQNGLAAHFKRKTEVAHRIRQFVLGLGLALYPKRPSDGITAVVAPAGFDIPGFRHRLEDEFGIQIGDGLGPLRSSVFRIGHVGDLTDSELDYFMTSFETALR